MTEYRHLQAELLLPSELREIMDECPVVYVPLGTYEFHGEHLPIGLDALNAHGVCLAAANRAGGVVLPPLYYGTGGTHGEYPWTIMTEDDIHIRALVVRTLQRLEVFGARTVVLFSGHFAPEQVDMLQDIADEWNKQAGDLRVVARAVDMPLENTPEPDHAGLFESTLFSAFWPGRVHLEKLPPLAETPSPDPDGDLTGPHRHDPAHPLWGVIGQDPRTLDPSQTPRLLDAIVSRLVSEVARERPGGMSYRRRGERDEALR